jgi:DNA uptake protein ComE-like DNA-binding protein
MPEIIIYQGDVPFVRFSKSDAEKDVAANGYRWTPLSAPLPPLVSIIPTVESVASPSAIAVLPDAVNVNAASLPELVELPDIGLAIANKIIAARPLHSVEDLIPLSGRVSWLGLVKNGQIYFGELSDV